MNYAIIWGGGEFLIVILFLSCKRRLSELQWVPELKIFVGNISRN